jgi:hypothetical protein
MSIAVELDRLRDEVSGRGPPAFVLTVTDDGRPHAVAVSVTWSDGTLVAGVGNRTARNADARAEVSVLWPATDPDGFSLIVDGTAQSPGEGGGRLVVAPTKAVLHRSRPEPDGSSASDCRTVVPRRPA